jgi:hypothetical protein
VPLGGTREADGLVAVKAGTEHDPLLRYPEIGSSRVQAWADHRSAPVDTIFGVQRRALSFRSPITSIEETSAPWMDRACTGV